MSPVPILISEILMCNIGGTALMIGNPPNVMIGSATHLDFNDFLINLAPVVVITVIVILIAVLLIFKNDFSSVRMSAKELEKLILCPAWKTNLFSAVRLWFLRLRSSASLSIPISVWNRQRSP